MALLERVSTLVRANLNDLIDKAEHPEKMIKQVILDMDNQLLQVKTQVAIAIADQHLLEKKQQKRRRPGPRRATARGKLSRTRRKFRRTGHRSEGTGRTSEDRTTPIGSKV